MESKEEKHMLGASPTGKSVGTYTPQHLCAYVSSVCLAVGLLRNPIQVLQSRQTVLILQQQNLT